MSHIFISYSRRDLDFASKIVQALADNQLDTWIDWKSIPKGEDWEQEICRGIEEADAFLFLISPDSVASEPCNKEIAHAVKNGKRILPIFIANVENRGIYDVTEKFLHKEQKDEICRRNFIICREGRDDFGKAIEEIQTTIHIDYEWLKYHTKLLVKAVEWERTKDASRLLRGRELREAEEQLTERQEDPQATDLQRKYLLNSRRNEERQRRRITAGLIVGLLIMFGITIVAVWQWQRADRQTKIALARQLAAQSQSIYSTGNSKQMVGVLVAIQSMKMFPSTEAAQVLQNNTLMQTISSFKHDNWVNSVAFSPDGKYVASGSADSTARVWEVATGREVARIKHDRDVNSVAFSRDGNLVVSGSSDGTARVWETTTGKEIARITHTKPVIIATFSPNGQYIVSGSEDGTAYTSEARTGEEISRVTYNGSVVSLAISPDGKYVVSGISDSTVRVWELATGNEIAKMVHENGVSFVAFSPNGKYVVSSGCDIRDKPGHCIKSTVRVWETITGREISRASHDDIVDSVAFSPDGMYVVSGGWDGIARVWEARTGKEIAKVIHDNWVNSVAFSPDGKYVVSGSTDSTARVWEVATGKEVARMTHGAGGVNSVAFRWDGKYVVSGGGDGVIRVWAIILDKEVARMMHAREVNSVAFSPDARYVISGSKDGIVHVWDSITGMEMFTINSGDDDVLSVAYSTDGRYLISGGCNQYYGGESCDLGTVRIWEVATRREVARITHEGMVYSVAISPDGKYVVSGSADGTACVWEMTTGAEISCIAHAGGVGSVAFSGDSQYVVSGSPGIIEVWEAATGKEISHMLNYAEVWTVAFAPDGKIVVSGSPDGTIRFWEVATGNEIARINTVDYNVTSIVFSPEGKYIASGNSDGTARVWETATGAEIARMENDGAVNSVAFSRDGKYLVSGSADKTMRVWLWHPSDLIDDACSRTNSKPHL